MSIRQRIRTGKHELVVTGTSKAGFRLASRDGAGNLSYVGPVHAKQKDAIEAGEREFNKTPKVVRPKKAA